MWRAPALDFVVNAGVTYQASTGMRVDRHASVVAAGEIAHLSYDAHVVDRRQGPAAIACACAPIARIPTAGCSARSTRPISPSATSRACRAGWFGSDPAAAALEVTNRPLFNPVAFDRTRFEGELPSGWDAELYRNGELLAFSRSDGSSAIVSTMSS